MTKLNPPPAEAAVPPKRLRGFAAMDPQRVREIASQGGIAAHEQGRAYEFTSEAARIAGRKRHRKAGGS